MDERQTGGRASSPHDILIHWANGQDAWVRSLVSAVFEAKGPVGDDVIEVAVETFLKEKHFVDAVESVSVPPLPTGHDGGAPLEPFSLRRLSDVEGVNALAEDQTVEFDPRLTVLFGQNGSGKTGYARIIKRAAGARLHEPILGDVGLESSGQTPRARFEVDVGGATRVIDWRNEESLAPLDRISVFDSELAAIHVDGDLEYVYTPAELARFGDVTSAIRGVQSRIQARAAVLLRESALSVNPFTQGTRVHEIASDLGPASPIGELRQLAEMNESELQRLAHLRANYAELASGSDQGRAASLRREAAELDELLEILPILSVFDADRYNTSLIAVTTAQSELRELRETLFASGELASAPDEAWQEFIEAGQAYADHLNLHQYPQADNRCLYCRQPLEPRAVALLRRYGEFLTGTAKAKLADAEASLEASTLGIDRGRLERLRDAFDDPQDPSETTRSIHSLIGTALDCLASVESQNTCTDDELPSTASRLYPAVDAMRDQLVAHERALAERQTDRDQSIRDLRGELNHLEDRQRLGEHMDAIDQCFRKSAEAQKLLSADQQISSSTLSSLTRASNEASQDLINRDFEQRFEAERVALKAPSVRLEFRGRRGAAQRQKHVASHRPSQILSEGEQKVLALADFIAECRMGSTKDPVLFDDPVSSLDYRRLEAVAERLANLASEHQVIVLTHNIAFVAALLELHNSGNQRITVMQLGERGNRKGLVGEDFEPRLDTPRKLSTRIEQAIEDASNAGLAGQEDLIARAYGLMRSWCEAFVEQELLGNAVQRYRPNIMMGRLRDINSGGLDDAVGVVERVFRRSSRFIDGHSNPHELQNALPSVEDLREDWAALQGARAEYRQR